MAKELRVGLMQPYFFPYLGYFDVINHTDLWIVYDTVQYKAHNWMNRNRVLHPTDGWQYITAPVSRHHLDTRICDIETVDGDGWRRRIIGQLDHYRRVAPYFRDTISLVSDCLARPGYSLARLNVEALTQVCARLGIGSEFRCLSEMNMTVASGGNAVDRVLNIAAAVGAAEFVNAPGGRVLYDPGVFERAGIRLTVRPVVRSPTSSPRHAELPAMSIIDTLMWNSPENIRAFLANRD